MNKKNDCFAVILKKKIFFKNNNKLHIFEKKNSFIDLTNIFVLLTLCKEHLDASNEAKKN
jgi:hypothetical protein